MRTGGGGGEGADAYPRKEYIQERREGGGRGEGRLMTLEIFFEVLDGSDSDEICITLKYTDLVRHVENE